MDLCVSRGPIAGPIAGPTAGDVDQGGRRGVDGVRAGGFVVTAASDLDLEDDAGAAAADATAAAADVFRAFLGPVRYDVAQAAVLAPLRGHAQHVEAGRSRRRPLRGPLGPGGGPGGGPVYGASLTGHRRRLSRWIDEGRWGLALGFLGSWV